MDIQSQVTVTEDLRTEVVRKNLDIVLHIVLQQNQWNIHYLINEHRRSRILRQQM